METICLTESKANIHCTKEVEIYSTGTIMTNEFCNDGSVKPNWSGDHIKIQPCCQVRAMSIWSTWILAPSSGFQMDLGCQESLSRSWISSSSRCHRRNGSKGRTFLWCHQSTTLSGYAQVSVQSGCQHPLVLLDSCPDDQQNYHHPGHQLSHLPLQVLTATPNSRTACKFGFPSYCTISSGPATGQKIIKGLHPTSKHPKEGEAYWKQYFIRRRMLSSYLLL